ncbi:MAG: hypothetical protein LBD37_09285 [Treponema sp.]|jgi:hypothetical protein|nr:hypothetical protein [Treponema sp.]
MNEIDVLHNQAMDLAEKAILLKISQKTNESVEAFNAAFSLEMQAAMQIQDKYDFEPSRSIMFRSAASLALNAGLFREAEKMIAIGLSGNPPEPIADELRDLYEDINFERHLKVKGVTLLDSDVQLSLSGNAASHGMIKADEFIKRAKIFDNMAIRTAERLLNTPFRERGRVPKYVKDNFQTYYSVPRAASFAITMRVGYMLNNYNLFEEENNIQVKVINDILENIEMINNHDEKKLENKIKNEDYFINTLGLIKKLSPDNKEVSLVGLTTSKKGDNNMVAFTRPTEEIKIAPIIHKIDVSEMEDTLICGKLNYADANKSDIRLETDDGESYTISVPKGVLADIVRPYWEQYVTISGKRQDKKIFFEDIQTEK